MEQLAYWAGRLENQQCDSRVYYHLLCGSLGQSVTVTQIVDLDIFDIISIRDIDVLARALGVGR